jgi:aminopeptidase N
MYYKGGNMLHTIRQVIDNDSTWRGILRGLNAEFRHRIVTGKQVEDYISAKAGTDLHPIFDQYLTTTKLPVFEYRLDGRSLSYRWADVVPNFAMPIRVYVAPDSTVRLKPTTTWQTSALPLADPGAFRIDENFFVETRWTAGATP